MAQHIAERGHNAWELAAAYDGASWDDLEVEWSLLGAYLGNGRFELD